MAYITKQDLYTHIYPEVLTEITRDYKTELANLAAFPEYGETGRYYIATDSGLYYKWDGDAYVQSPYIDVVGKAITAGVNEVKSYLNRYDLIKMFSDNDELRIFSDENLNNKVKDVICWYVYKLCNANINLELARDCYEDAIKYFEKVMTGKIDPTWPYRVDNPDTALDESGHIFFNSNIKRKQHY